MSQPLLTQLLFKNYPPLPTQTSSRKHFIDGKPLRGGRTFDTDPNSFPSKLTALITGDKWWSTTEMAESLQTTMINVYSAIRRSPKRKETETYTENTPRGKIKYYRIKP